jgi:hypothetical protein
MEHGAQRKGTPELLPACLLLGCLEKNEETEELLFALAVETNEEKGRWLAGEWRSMDS